MKNVRVAFNILHGDDKIPPAYQFMMCHMLFDIKINDFNRKAQYVSGGHMTEPPSSITYPSVVSREIIRIALTMSEINDLEIFYE